MGGHVRGMVHMWGTEDSLSVLLFTFLWVLQACMWSAFFTPWATSLPWLLPSLSSLPRSFPLHHHCTISYCLIGQNLLTDHTSQTPLTPLCLGPRPLRGHILTRLLYPPLLPSFTHRFSSPPLSSSSHRHRIPASGSASGKLIDSTTVTSSVLSRADSPPAFYCFSHSVTLREGP